MLQWKKKYFKELSYIDYQKAEELIKAYDGVVDSELSELLIDQDESKVYVLNNGQCIVTVELDYEIIWGTLYYSRDEARKDLLKSIEKQEENKKKIKEQEANGYDIFFEHPIGDDFLIKINQYVSELPEKIDLNQSDFDFSLQRLQKIDVKLQNLNLSYEELKPMYRYFVAYCGQVLLKEIQGKWVIKKGTSQPRELNNSQSEFIGNNVTEFANVKEFTYTGSWKFDKPYIISEKIVCNPWYPVYSALFSVTDEEAAELGLYDLIEKEIRQAGYRSQF